MTYHRIGFDHRPMQFQEDGIVGLGSDRMERYRHLAKKESKFVLEIDGDDGLTAHFFAEDSCAAKWQGHWAIHERMPVELVAREGVK